MGRRNERVRKNGLDSSEPLTPLAPPGASRSSPAELGCSRVQIWMAKSGTPDLALQRDNPPIQWGSPPAAIAISSASDKSSTVRIAVDRRATRTPAKIPISLIAATAAATCWVAIASS